MTGEDREPVEDEVPKSDEGPEIESEGAPEEQVTGAESTPEEQVPGAESAPEDEAAREHAPPFEGEVAPPADPQEVAETAEEFIRGLLTAMGLDADVRTTVESDNVFVDVTGEGLGILIGRRGQALEALQEVARTAG